MAQPIVIFYGFLSKLSKLCRLIALKLQLVIRQHQQFSTGKQASGSKLQTSFADLHAIQTIFLNSDYKHSLTHVIITALQHGLGHVEVVNRNLLLTTYYPARLRCLISSENTT